MPDKTTSPKTEPESKRFPTEIVVALITLVGAIITGYFTYVAPLQLSIKATQTAEARGTQSALSVTPSPRPVTAIPSSTPTRVIIDQDPSLTPPPPITETVTPTATIAGQPGGDKYCVNVRSVYVRVGPGADYGAFGGLNFEDCLYFDSRISYTETIETEYGPRERTLTWLRISDNQPDYADFQHGWVRADLLRPEDYDQLPVITLTPTPTPTITPSVTPTPLG
jgi:hypothetical protein